MYTMQRRQNHKCKSVSIWKKNTKSKEKIRVSSGNQNNVIQGQGPHMENKQIKQRK